jgi:hypothetical protein
MRRVLQTLQIGDYLDGRARDESYRHIQVYTTDPSCKKKDAIATAERTINQAEPNHTAMQKTTP